MDDRGRMDVSDYSISRLEDLARRVRRAIVKKRTDDRPMLGLSERGGAMYRNPENACETWSGRGRRPAWFDRAVARGRSPESLLG